MSSALLVIYFGTPLVAVLIPVFRESMSIDGANVILAIVVNYLFLAFPQICWFGLGRFLDVSRIVWNTVFVAATVSLIGIVLVFEFWIWNGNGLGWFYYLPVAVGSMVLAGYGALVFEKRRAHVA